MKESYKKRDSDSMLALALADDISAALTKSLHTEDR
jgi:hypothetical protein